MLHLIDEQFHILNQYLFEFHLYKYQLLEYDVFYKINQQFHLLMLNDYILINVDNFHYYQSNQL